MELGKKLEEKDEKMVVFLSKSNQGGATKTCEAGTYGGKTYSDLLCKSSMWVTANLWKNLKQATVSRGGFDIYLPARNNLGLLLDRDVLVNLLDASYSGDEASKTVKNYFGKNRPGRYVIVSPISSSIAITEVEKAIKAGRGTERGASEDKNFDKVSFVTGKVWQAPAEPMIADGFTHYVVEWKAPDRKSIGDVESICGEVLHYGSPYSQKHGNIF